MAGAALLSAAAAASVGGVDDIMRDSYLFWSKGYRDQSNGLYCDRLSFSDGAGCNGGVYSAAAVGMGLVSEVVFAELGLQTVAATDKRVLQTLESIQASWPRERFHGFYVHFTSAPAFSPGSEFSTVDSAEMVAGALFAGNWLGGIARERAFAIAEAVDWSAAIKSATDPTIFPIVNGTTGDMGGLIRPFNEYYIVAYLAAKFEKARSFTGKAQQYFDTYFGSTGRPKGANGFPVHLPYHGNDLLSDNDRRFMSSFIPIFCWLLTAGWHTNPYYANTLFPAWLNADREFWKVTIPRGAHVWGKPIEGRLWGSGAGTVPSGYGVDRINETEPLVASTAIMAGFLGATKANSSERAAINVQLRWLYDNDVCAYLKRLPGLKNPVKVLWRCSVLKPDWRAGIADSIDHSTFVLGYAINWLPVGFFGKYAA